MCSMIFSCFLLSPCHDEARSLPFGRRCEITHCVHRPPPIARYLPTSARRPSRQDQRCTFPVDCGALFPSRTNSCRGHGRTANITRCTVATETPTTVTAAATAPGVAPVAITATEGCDSHIGRRFETELHPQKSLAHPLCVVNLPRFFTLHLTAALVRHLEFPSKKNYKTVTSTANLTVTW